jgi:hypothetical protein
LRLPTWDLSSGSAGGDRRHHVVAVPDAPQRHYAASHLRLPDQVVAVTPHQSSDRRQLVPCDEAGSGAGIEEHTGIGQRHERRAIEDLVHSRPQAPCEQRRPRNYRAALDISRQQWRRLRRPTRPPGQLLPSPRWEFGPTRARFFPNPVGEGLESRQRPAASEVPPAAIAKSSARARYAPISRRSWSRNGKEFCAGPRSVWAPLGGANLSRNRVHSTWRGCQGQLRRRDVVSSTSDRRRVSGTARPPGTPATRSP